jgi:threonine dehydrogenase-like Zn-dependent dehydrogenase
MRALVFGVEPEPWEPPDTGNTRLRRLAESPVALTEIADPRPLRPDWVITKPLLSGVCGSDAKQIFMDFADGGHDNAMSAFASFPQVLGHEVVAEVAELGPEATGLDRGQRVVLNPWLSCGPRGIKPLCDACEAGDFNLCHNFTVGPISKGIHTGVSSDATGGFAELMPAHDSMLIPVPANVSDEQAVLADPFSVSLHAVLRHPPLRGMKALVHGAGSLGCTTLAVLKALFPEVEVAIIARFTAQARLALSMGADLVLRDDSPDEIIEQLATWSGATVLSPLAGLPFTHPGKIDIVYDTIGGPETLEIGVRVLKSRGTLVQTGVNNPGRWEWTPLYFKEIMLAGSNAFGIEEIDGVRKHAIAHYLELVASGRVDLSAMLTQTFRLDAWHDAFIALANQEESGAIKVAFDMRQQVGAPARTG